MASHAPESASVYFIKKKLYLSRGACGQLAGIFFLFDFSIFYFLFFIFEKLICKGWVIASPLLRIDFPYKSIF